LREAGAEVRYHDPYVRRLGRFRKYRFDLESLPLTPEMLGTMDAVLIVTDHAGVDYEMVVRHAPLVVDTRNATRGVREGREKILKA
jgi:UDP-N-acetyl-D-glucosamine dehydrogenase